MDIFTDDLVVVTAQKTAHDVRRYAAPKLRSMYPYMKTNTMEKLLEKVETDFKQGILDQESEHRETKSRTSFFSLSAELRNTIYEIVLAVEPIDRHRLSSGKKKKETVHDRRIGPRPSILSVSKQVRSETLSIFYSTGLYTHIHGLLGPKGMSASARMLRSYLRMLGRDQAGMIKRLRISIWREDDWSQECARREERGDFDDPRAVQLFLRNYDLHDLGVPQAAWVIDTF
ncbi:hypothetical protein HII31_07704 [Pseudocercospora fuligena]|uniref:Uncharacterized protein n=1 Tax=Pseudocercospora fuligena TaxID=685502 RepID=A0A8H6REV1_9PEZI|nr:hypothetical protein HII31_07704 [Pseudocercospora fuligena]